VKEANRLGSRATMFGLAAFVALGGTNACATAGEGSTSSSRRNEITLEELEATSVDDVMEAISLLRPQWMRGRSAAATIVVNGQRSTRDHLATIPVGSIVRISFMSAADATTRFGMGFSEGAIVVTLR
jgi:hypothetical protein